VTSFWHTGRAEHPEAFFLAAAISDRIFAKTMTTGRQCNCRQAGNLLGISEDQDLEMRAPGIRSLNFFVSISADTILLA